MNQYTNKNQVKLILVGNKCDLERKIKKEEGEKMAQKEGMLYFETSAKTSDGVINMFYTSFSFIDFFNDKRKDKGKIDENIVKELIEQNTNKNNNNYITPPNNKEDAMTQEILLDNNNYKSYKYNKNGSLPCCTANTSSVT